MTTQTPDAVREARRIAADVLGLPPGLRSEYMNGKYDTGDHVRIALAALDSRAGDAGEEDAIESIVAERQRQITKGWTAEHDDLHVDGEIATQAIYVLRGWNVRRPASMGRSSERTWVDPYKHNPRECLVIAAALVVAEIERIDRMTAAEQTAIEDWSE